jgi:hypothetical protein
MHIGLYVHPYLGVTSVGIFLARKRFDVALTLLILVIDDPSLATLALVSLDSPILRIV